MKHSRGKMFALIALSLLVLNACAPADLAQAAGDDSQEEFEENVAGGSLTLSEDEDESQPEDQSASLSVIELEVEGEDSSDDSSSDLEEDQHLTGVVEAISATTITIDGVVYVIDENTEIDDGLVIGALARLEFITLPDGTLLLTSIEFDAEDDEAESDEDQHLTGFVEQITETTITIDGVVYTIDENTEIDDGLEIGAFARIEFFTLEDGTLLLKEIEFDGDDDIDGDDDDEDDDRDEHDDEEDDDDDSSGSGSEHEDEDDDDRSGSDHDDDEDND